MVVSRVVEIPRGTWKNMCVCVGGVFFKVLPPRYAFFMFFLSVGLLCPSCFVYILLICMANKTRFPPILHQGRSQCESRGQTPGGTQLLFWYRCSARRAANGGLKKGKVQKKWGLKNWLLEKIGLKELNFWKNRAKFWPNWRLWKENFA